MPSIEFKGIPAEKYPPYAGHFQMACVRWQMRKGISLPTRAFLAREFSLKNAHVFTDVFEGKYLPPALTILAIARACGDSVEEHLTIANIDLNQRHRSSYDTFTRLMDWVRQEVSGKQREEYLRMLAETQTTAWGQDVHSPAKRRAEEILCRPDADRDLKVAGIVQAIQIWSAEQKPSRRQPDAGAVGLAVEHESIVTAIA